MKYQKGTFIQVPNLHVLTRMDAPSQVVFMWLCKYSNSYGECFPSVETLRKRTSLSRATIFDRLNRLEEHGIITRKKRVSKNGDQETNLYQILIVEMDVENEEGGPADGRGVVQELDYPRPARGHRTISTGEYPIVTTRDAKRIAPVAGKKWQKNDPMTLQDFIVWAKESPQRHIQIIGEWAEAEGPDFKTYDQWQSYISRHVKVARRLAAFSMEQIESAYARLAKDVKSKKNPKGYITRYSLETLEKYLLA